MGQRCVTPRQTCPRPDGFGRNLRSKTRWFTGSCNSHHVSHFATFFIDARAEISVAESRYDLYRSHPMPPCEHDGRELDSFGDSLAHPAPWVLYGSEERPGSRPSIASGRFGRIPSPSRVSVHTGSRVVLPLQVSTMILPQVHLRKPCYDFSFL